MLFRESIKMSIKGLFWLLLSIMGKTIGSVVCGALFSFVAALCVLVATFALLAVLVAGVVFWVFSCAVFVVIACLCGIWFPWDDSF